MHSELTPIELIVRSLSRLAPPPNSSPQTRTFAATGLFTRSWASTPVQAA
jgi:hypothetical protein